MQEKKARKPYPTLDERIALVNSRIEHLARLKEEREALVKKTEEILAERMSALDKCREQLEKAQLRRKRLLEQKNKTEHGPSRADKSAERKRLDELLSVIKAKGLSLEDVAAALNGI